jgi:L-2,4-diaminobutyrate decarboxylase
MSSSSDLRLQVWNPTQVRRLARELADLAAAELTRDASGPVLAPDFGRRAKQILKRRFTAAEIPAIVRDLAEASLHLNHPRYMAQQVAAPVPVAALVESVVGALNQSLAVWDMSPAAMYIDRDLIGRFRALFGYPQTAEGSLVPGGSFANLTAMLAARAALQPSAWKKGGGRIAVLTGAHTHYSISRAIGIMGLGTECVFAVPTDERYRTDARQVAAQARKARAAGYRRFILAGSCGATATGSCDDLPALAEEARKLRAWFHVDAAHGGGFAFSRKMKAKLNGIDAADSMIFDPHNMLLISL